MSLALSIHFPYGYFSNIARYYRKKNLEMCSVLVLELDLDWFLEKTQNPI